jgi:hypothetical protein
MKEVLFHNVCWHPNDAGCVFHLGTPEKKRSNIMKRLSIRKWNISDLDRQA